MPSFLICSVCGKLVTEKRSRGRHLACRPVPKYTRYTHTCPTCGEVKELYQAPGQAKRRTCMKCRDFKGAANSNWRGGIRPAATQLRYSRQMYAWREAVFTRDNYTCVLCGQRGGELNADHIWPFALVPELALTEWNGRTLCKACHKKTPTYLGGATQFLKELMPDPADLKAFHAGRLLIYEALLNGDDVDKLTRCFEDEAS